MKLKRFLINCHYYKLKAFTLLEIVFAIIIISIIAATAVSKLSFNIDDANKIKIKSDIAMIRGAIISEKNQRLLKGNNTGFIDKLDIALNDVGGEMLFGGYDDKKLLQYPLISTSTTVKELGKWNKLSNAIYQVWLLSNKAVVFEYDKDIGSFDCDFSDELCKELTQ